MEKLGNRQTKDRIAEMLREEILSGRIADGEELAQEQLAETLGVSRMPVREALQILELEGLLLRLPNRHMQVVGLCRRTVDENLRLIGAVESEIVIMRLERDDPFPEEMDPTDDHTFHRSLSNQAHNPYLRQTHHRLLSGYPAYIWSHCGPGRFTEQNGRILASIKAGDAASTRRQIRSYYRDLAQALLALGKESPNEQSKAD